MLFSRTIVTGVIEAAKSTHAVWWCVAGCAKRRFIGPTGDAHTAAGRTRKASLPLANGRRRAGAVSRLH